MAMGNPGEGSYGEHKNYLSIHNSYLTYVMYSLGSTGS